MDDSIQAAMREAAAIRDQAIADAHAGYESMVRAIETLTAAGWTVARKSPEAIQSPSESMVKPAEDPPQLTDAVREYAKAHEGEEFTVNDVEAWLNMKWPGISPRERRATLSSILIRLATQLHEISVRHAGKGSRPTVYYADHEDYFGIDKPDDEEENPRNVA